MCKWENGNKFYFQLGMFYILEMTNDNSNNFGYK